MSLSPAAVFIVLLAIGIVAGLVFDRFAGPGWVKRQMSGARPIMITSALVGIAGSFVGYQLAGLLSVSGYGALLVAVVAAFAVLYGWRMVK